MKSLLPHPNVVLFRGVTLPPDPFCIVLEYCKEGSLLKYLQTKEVSESQKLQWSKEIAQGMVKLFFFIYNILASLT